MIVAKPLTVAESVSRVRRTTFPALRLCRQDSVVSSSVVQVSLQDLSPGEVVIESRYSSVNHKDALAVTGTADVVRQFPRIAGIDVAGVVIESEDSRFAVGSEVVCTNFGMGVEHDGGYAAYCRVPGDWVVPLDPRLSLRESMILGTAGLTAALAIRELETNGLAPHGGKVVVNGATGGVGMLLVDILSASGYEVVAMTGRPEHASLLRRLGAADVIGTPPPQGAAKPLEQSMWAAAFDSVGGEQLAWLARTVRPGGVIASFGNAGGNQLSLTVLPFILRGIRIIGINVRTLSVATRSQLWRRLADGYRPRFLEAIATMVPLDGVIDACHSLLQRRCVGRIVLQL